MSPENTKLTNQSVDDEIDIIAFAQTFWSGRLIVLKSVLICGLIGLIFAIFMAKEFTAITIMIPSSSDGTSKLGSLAGLGGLAAMAGININATSGNDISPTIYPQIVSSIPYQLELMKTSLNFSKLKNSVTLFEYYTEIQKPNSFLRGIRNILQISIMKDSISKKNENEPIELTDKQKDVLKILSENILLEVNAKEGLLTLTAKMPEARAAAQLGQRAQELLQKYITEFKIKKAKSNLDFIQQRYDETAKKSETAQQALASFRDRNKNMSLATAKTEEERLSSQYNLIYGVFSELAKQLEQAKIQVKQDTPVFTIIEPVSVPTEKSKPNRPIILTLWLLVGCILGTGIIFGKHFTSSIKKRWYKTQII